MNLPLEYRGPRKLFYIALLALLFCSLTVMTGTAFADENGASVYPTGVETVMPGMTPPPGGTMFYEYTAVVTANQLDGANGQALPIDFRLRVFANAFKITHNWGWHFLGGTVESNMAVPFVDQELHLPIPVGPDKFTKFAAGNICVSPFGVGYARGRWHFYYEGDVWFPGTGRSSSDPLNIGQNNYAVAPVTGITYLRGKEELSSKIQYIVNMTDKATNYHSGQDLSWEFDGMHSLNRKIAVGVNGYLYKQMTDDMQNGVVFENGNRARALAVGPEVRFNLITHGGFAIKYLHDTLVENRPPTNALWFQLAVPITVGHHE